METHRPASMPSPVQFKEKTGIVSEATSEFVSGKCYVSNGENDQVKVDIDHPSSSIAIMMSQNLIMSDKCCIFRVPPILRRHRESAYIPNAFSIGPWHHMKSTENIKLKYLEGLLSRESKSGLTLEELYDSTKDIEKEARSCYEEPFDVGVEDFVRILVIDGCFLIELFRKDKDIGLREDDDPIFNMACMMQYLYHDLILVENQIPWLVLEHLFNKTSAKQSTQAKGESLAQLALKFFDNTFSFDPPNTNILYHRKKHLLDLLRYWLILSSEKHYNGYGTWEPIPSATNLVDAGIKFKVVNSKEISILDIKFNDGFLEIPSLLIHETTEVVIRNLISYEQCSPQCTDTITSYAVLLDNLINTTKDLDILTSRRIINNWLNPEEAMQFFNKLYHDACLTTYYYKKLCQDVNKYSQRRWPRWRAILMRNYFGTPWAIVSMLAAATLLILTAVQTIFTIIK